MERYEVTATQVEIHAGILQLDPEQAAARAHALDTLGEGLYQVRRPVQFKRGESFGYDGAVGKGMLQAVKPSGKRRGK
jgi:hypothetical protein